jgi:cell division control protein 6
MLTQPHVFDEGWVPEDLHARDGETNALASALSPITRGANPDPVLLSGPPGVGKTATAQWVLEDLDHETQIDTVLVDCWSNHRPYQAYSGLLQGLGRPGVVQPKTPRQTLRERVRSTLPDHGCVVVLDEADQLDDPSLVDRWNAMDGIALVLIVNDAGRFESRLHRENMDVTFDTSIPYQPYTHETLVNILRPRAKQALDPTTWQADHLEALASFGDGNAREAIQGLRAAVDTARDNGLEVLTKEAVRTGHERAVTQIRRKTRSRLQRHERIILDVLESHGESTMSTLYESYHARLGEDARGKRRVRDYLNKLASYNLISIQGECRGRTYCPQPRNS